VQGVAYALVGDDRSARAVMETAKAKWPEWTLGNRVLTPEIESLLAHNPQLELSELEAARAYDLADPMLAYLRANAYLRMGSGAQASAEFHKIIEHPFFEPRSIVHALARLGLARAYAEMRDTANARRSYQDFLASWKDADPDIPILKQAKAEYAQAAITASSSEACTGRGR
jgi:eukaryotic-like serine/threonine-protein kinase